MTSPAAPATPKTAAPPTEYVILAQDLPANKSDGQGDGWLKVNKVTARSANEAVKAACGGKAGLYVAIPARSFQPVTVKVETKTTIKLG